MQPFIEEKSQSVAESSVKWSTCVVSSWSIDLQDGWQIIDMLIRDSDKCLHSSNQQGNHNDVNTTAKKIWMNHVNAAVEMKSTNLTGLVLLLNNWHFITEIYWFIISTTSLT